MIENSKYYYKEKDCYVMIKKLVTEEVEGVKKIKEIEVDGKEIGLVTITD